MKAISLSEKLSVNALLRFKDRPVVLLPNSTYTYADLVSESQTLLAKLAAHGCKPGAVVVAKLGSGFNFLALLLAAIEAQLVFIPFAPSFPPSRFHAIAQQFGALVSFTEAEGELTLSKTDFRDAHSKDYYSQFDGLFSQGGFVRYTSGTTGNAKGVFVSLQSAEARIFSAQAGLNLPPYSRLFWPLEMALHFVAVLPVVLLQGGAFVLAEGGSTKDQRDAIEKCEANAIYAAPHHYQQLAREPYNKHRVVRAFSTTAPISNTVAAQFYASWGTRVDQVYGIFELGIVCAQDENHRNGVGKPMPGVTISIRDATGLAMKPGVAGRVCISTPGAMDGYLQPLSNSADILVDGWFETGDIGTVTGAGELILLGRAAGMINVVGAKVYPEQVEEVLLSGTGVKAARVFGKPHELLGNIVCAEVVLNSGVVFEPVVLRRLCRSQLNRYSVPQEISQVEQIAFTEAGKISRIPNGSSIV